MASILASQSAEMRAKGEAMIQQADKLLCESWNERMWSDGEPIDPTPTIDQAVNGGFPWLEIQCARCKTPSDDEGADCRPPSRRSILYNPVDDAHGQRGGMVGPFRTSKPSGIARARKARCSARP